MVRHTIPLKQLREMKEELMLSALNMGWLNTYKILEAEVEILKSYERDVLAARERV